MVCCKPRAFVVRTAGTMVVDGPARQSGVNTLRQIAGDWLMDTLDGTNEV